MKKIINKLLKWYFLKRTGVQLGRSEYKVHLRHRECRIFSQHFLLIDMNFNIMVKKDPDGKKYIDIELKTTNLQLLSSGKWSTVRATLNCYSWKDTKKTLKAISETHRIWYDEN